MNSRTVINMLNAGFVIVIILIQTACSTSTPQVLPTDTVMPDTPTPADTPPPTNTSTPEATSTFTPTKTITPTFTPNVTATLLPEITPAVEGKGNVAGLVLWNNQPVPRAAVWLCERFEGDCLGNYQYRSNTDQNGYYVFGNVTPGKYLVAINSFSSGWFIFYFDSDGNREQQVSEGQDLILDPWSIWKFDLRATTPKIDQVLADAMPTFKWESYPDAVSYHIYIYDINFNAMQDHRVDSTEFTLTQPLITCRFYWDVEAYNAQGDIIAAMSDYMYFYVIDVPGSC